MKTNEKKMHFADCDGGFPSVPQIFQRLIFADKRDVQGDGPFPDGINVTIRRNYIYEDAYDKLSPENGKSQFTFLDYICAKPVLRKVSVSKKNK